MLDLHRAEAAIRQVADDAREGDDGAHARLPRGEGAGLGAEIERL